MTKPINLYLSLIVIALFIGVGFWKVLHWSGESATERAIRQKMTAENISWQQISFNLTAPSFAPESIRSEVERGFKLMIHTKELLPEFVGNELNCTNCHFAGGNTTGGKNGGLSLAGVAALYPRYEGSLEKVTDLPGRINACFEKSMNGKALPGDHPDLIALVSYCHWISKGIPIYEKVPWIGVKSQKKNLIANAQKGAVIYQTYCALCHGVNGDGGTNIPPVWGPGAYHALAGMNDVELGAVFIELNMPYQDPRLTAQEAADVSAFLNQQPRPGSEKK